MAFPLDFKMVQIFKFPSQQNSYGNWTSYTARQKKEYIRDIKYRLWDVLCLFSLHAVVKCN